eukprot:584573-Pelagomonas_calceolata.AAC.1
MEFAKAMLEVAEQVRKLSGSSRLQAGGGLCSDMHLHFHFFIMTPSEKPLHAHQDGKHARHARHACQTCMHIKMPDKHKCPCAQ